MPDNNRHIEQILVDHALPKVFAGEPRDKSSQVWECEFRINRGDRIIIEAASGTGKSSLCAYIFGSRRDYSGRILFDGNDVSTFSPDRWQEIRRCNIAYLPQELSLFPELTAIQNIRLKNDLTGHASEERIQRWMEELGVDMRADFPVGKMSVGQQQRVALIRALCQPFDFILLDEPVSHLDDANNAIAARMVEEEAARQGAAIIATSVGNQIALTSPKIVTL